VVTAGARAGMPVGNMMGGGRDGGRHGGRGGGRHRFGAKRPGDHSGLFSGQTFSWTDLRPQGIAATESVFRTKKTVRVCISIL
jgi:hypothetical protein